MTNFKQGILYVTGFNNASGHIAPWDGQKEAFEDGNVFEARVRDTDRTAFWELRPDWLAQ